MMRSLRLLRKSTSIRRFSPFITFEMMWPNGPQNSFKVEKPNQKKMEINLLSRVEIYIVKCTNITINLVMRGSCVTNFK